MIALIALAIIGVMLASARLGTWAADEHWKQKQEDE